MQALRRAYRHTGAAVAASGITAIAGFGVLVLSDIAMLRDFGLVTLIDLGLSRCWEWKGIETGQPIPPFAVPLAAGTLTGDADIATHANDGSAGRVAACAERGPQILNVCELYERGPVVLALFVDGGSCPAVLDDMQALTDAFPGVSFAAVAIKGERPSLRKLMREQGLTRVQVGFDSDGVAGLYKMTSCPAAEASCWRGCRAEPGAALDAVASHAARAGGGARGGVRRARISAAQAGRRRRPAS